MMKKIILPAGSLIVLAIVFVLAFKIGVGKVMALRENLALARKNEEILAAKADLLSNIEPSLISQTDLLVTVLPNKNPALLTLSQIKNLAIAQNLTLSNINMSSGEGGGVDIASGVGISFDIEGGAPALVNLVSSLKQIAPITQVDNVAFDFSGSLAQATVSVKTYWAEFPEKIPSLLDPVAPLSEAEKDVLQTVSGLTIPSFVGLVPSEPFERVNPFGE